MITIDARQAMKYGSTIALVSLLLVGIVIAFNIVVDPYGMYHLIDLKEVNRHKQAIYHRVRLAKAYDVRRIQPQSIILGTSRTHLGIRPSHPAWSADAKPIYNLAFDGATTKEMYYYLRHANAVHPLRRVLLGLDTYHLTNAPAAIRPDFDPQLLLSDDSFWSRAQVFLADLRLLISFDTLKDGVVTILSQQQAPPEWFAADGQRLGEVFFRQPWEHFQTLGPRAYFDEIDKNEVSYKLEWRKPQKTASPVKKSPDAEADPVTSLGYVQKIVEFSRAHNIELMVYITPSHVHQMELDALTGGWPAIENGKRALVKMLAEDASAHPGRTAIVVFDFSGYSSVTTESLPPVGSRDEMKYYWESSHFKDRTGDLVLNRIFNRGEVPADFGVRLDSATIESSLAEIRQRQTAYRLAYPDDVALLRGYIERYVTENNIQDWKSD